MTRLRITTSSIVVAALVLLPPVDSHAVTLPGMVAIPSGSFEPLYGIGGTTRTKVSSFHIDRDPVTRAQFLAFVRKNPEWQRSAARPALVANGYLADWNSDTSIGSELAIDSPVTSVSWFAARAYCKAQGKRLPTVAEWEYVAAASETERDAARKPAFIQAVLERYMYRGQGGATRSVARGEANVYGVRGMHDLVAEWVEDFNSVLVSDDSRAIGARDHDLYCASAAIGALDPKNYPAFLRYALRSGLSGRSTITSLGFRCAA